MSGYLIYHPKRQKSSFGDLTIYHDSIGGNQDPYVWNARFLHTYCHITQMSPQPGDINFWVSGGDGNLRNFTQLTCDLVFFVEEKIYWQQSNSIRQNAKLVDSPEAYADHYQWAKYQHPLKRKQRFTLKAAADKSFQPQNVQQQLIDIVPLLQKMEFSLEQLRVGMRAGFNSKPFKLSDDKAQNLYKELAELAAIKLKGSQLQPIRKDNSQLVSAHQGVKCSS